MMMMMPSVVFEVSENSQKLTKNKIIIIYIYLFDFEQKMRLGYRNIVFK